MASLLKSKINFFFKAPVSIKNRAKLKKFIESIFRMEKKKLQSLNYVFCTDNDLLEINRQYLKHDYYTDIITFKLSGHTDPVEGEIYISVNRVRDNSLILGEPLTKELHRIIFHGVLHLCGYKDKSKVEKEKMRGKEESLLFRYFK